MYIYIYILKKYIITIKIFKKMKYNGVYGIGLKFCITVRSDSDAP